jgi:hypothetical protein
MKKSIRILLMTVIVFFLGCTSVYSQNCNKKVVKTETAIDQELKDAYWSKDEIANEKKRLGKFYRYYHSLIVTLGMAVSMVSDMYPYQGDRIFTKTQKMEGNTLTELWTSKDWTSGERVLFFKEDVLVKIICRK